MPPLELADLSNVLDAATLFRRNGASRRLAAARWLAGDFGACGGTDAAKCRGFAAYPALDLPGGPGWARWPVPARLAVSSGQGHCSRSCWNV